MLDITARSNGHMPIIVPVESHGQQVLVKHTPGAVLPRFVLIAHHRHLGSQLFGRDLEITADVAVDHAIRFQTQGPTQTLFRSLEGLEIVGAIEGCLAVGARASLGQLCGDVRMCGGSLEQHVFQEMRHARFAVVLVPAAHQIGHVHGDRGLARIREEQDTKTIGQPELRDALDGSAADD